MDQQKKNDGPFHGAFGTKLCTKIVSSIPFQHTAGSKKKKEIEKEKEKIKKHMLMCDFSISIHRTIGLSFQGGGQDVYIFSL